MWVSQKIDECNSIAQFVRKKDKIDVDILKVVGPSHFLVKECLSLSLSKEASQFQELERRLNRHYNAVLTEHLFVPDKDDIVVAKHNSNYYRAQVQFILDTTKGLNYSIYLLDYGIVCRVSRTCVFEIKKQYLSVPFQAVNFHLIGLKPLGLNINQLDCSLAYEPVSEWDKSAEEFVKEFCKNATSFQIEVFGYDDINHLFGQLHTHAVPPDLGCLNDILIKQNFAYFEKNELMDVIKITTSQNLPADVETLMQNTEATCKTKEKLNFEMPLGDSIKITQSNSNGETTHDELQSSASGMKKSPSFSSCRPESSLPLQMNGQNSISPTSFKNMSPLKRGILLKVDIGLLPTSQDALIRTSSPFTNKSVASSPVLKPSKQVNPIAASITAPEVTSTVKAYPPVIINNSSALSTQSIKKCIRVPSVSLDSTSVSSDEIKDDVSTTSESALSDISQVLSPECYEATKTLDQKSVAQMTKEFYNISKRRSKRTKPSLKSANLSVNKSSGDHSSGNASSAYSLEVFQESSEETNCLGESTSEVQTSPHISSNLTGNSLRELCSKFKDSKCNETHSVPLLDVTCTLSSSNVSPTSLDSDLLPSKECSPHDLLPNAGVSLSQKDFKSEICSSTQPRNTSTNVSQKTLDSKSAAMAIKEFYNIRKKKSSKHSMSPNDSSDNASCSETAIDPKCIENGCEEIAHRMKHHITEEKSKVARSAQQICKKLNINSQLDAFCPTDLDFSSRILFEQQGVPVVQIGGQNLKPIQRTEEAPFVKTLHKHLNSIGFWGPSCIQSVVWPAVFRGRSFVACAPPHSGKTAAYLLPILSNIINRTDYDNLPPGKGPIAVILCSSWKKVETVDRQIHFLIGNSGKVSVFSAWNNISHSEEQKADASKGSDILVVTLSYLLKQLANKETNLERCCHLILDDGNDIIRNQAEKLVEFMAKLLCCLKSLRNVSHSVQMGMCVERWTRKVKSFLDKYMLNSLLLFTSFLEAAVYRHISVHLQMCREATKASFLINLLGSRPGWKVVICVVDVEAAIETWELLHDAAIYAHLAHESILHFNLSSVKEKWNNHRSDGSPFILVLTDAVLMNLNIIDADCLIHYDLPSLSQLQFGNRFGCIAKFLEHQEKSKEVVCHIFVTEQCGPQAPSLVSIMQRMQSHIPKELKHIAHHKKQDSVDSNIPVCPYLKAFGKCPLATCFKRHVIDNDLDAPRVTPSQGDVHIRINHVFSAVHYCAQILRYIEPLSGVTVSRTNEYAKLVVSLQDYFSLPQNHITLKDIVVDSFCCIKEISGTYHRAKILAVNESHCTKVTLMYLDEGFVKTLPSDQLLVLPNKFCEPAPLAAEVYVCGIKPSDFCPDWNPIANQFILDNIGGNEVNGKIVLCLGDTLFLDPMIIQETKLSFVKEPVTVFHVTQELKNQGFAIDNATHLSQLTDAACKGGINLPKLIKKSSDPVALAKPKWEKLEMGVEEDVYVSHIESPHLLFVQKASLADRLDELNANIMTEIEKNAIPLCPVLQKGMFCLAAPPGDSGYQRGQVTEIFDENEELFAQVHFLDFGDSYKVNKNNLYTLSRELMFLMPFQAIECEIHDTIPPHGGWSEQCIDKLFDWTRNEENCMLQLKAKAHQQIAKHAGSDHFIVNLSLSNSSLLDLLIAEGLVSPSEPPVIPIEDLDVKVVEDVPNESDDSDTLYKKDSATFYNAIIQSMVEDFKQLNDYKDSFVKKKKKGTSQKQITTTSKAFIEEVSDSDQVDIPSGLKPNVVWWNNKHDLTVSVALPGMKDHNVDFQESGFTFSAQVNEKSYNLNELFYDKIIPQNTTVEAHANGVKMVFVKEIDQNWPRLTKSNKKVSYIKYDPDRIDSDSEDECVEKPNDNIIVPVQSDSEYGNTDDSKIHYYEESSEKSSDESEEYEAAPWSKTQHIERF